MASFPTVNIDSGNIGMNATRPNFNHLRTVSSASMPSEDLFPSITGFEDYSNEDDLDFDEMDESKDGLGDLTKGEGAKKLRRSASSADKKATHNAVERARRECLNTRFLVLADLLPGMNHVKRASKAAIVNKSIDFIRDLKHAETRMAKENEALRIELAALRQRAAAPVPHLFTPAVGLPQQMHALPSSAEIETAATVRQSARQEKVRPSSAPHNHRHLMPSFAEAYGNLFSAGSLTDPPLEKVLSEEDSSPSSASSSLPQYTSTTAFFQPDGFYDIAALTNAGVQASDANNGSPLSYHSPPGTAASHNGLNTHSVNGNKDFSSASSPSSIHSVQTPGNAYSPTSLPGFTATGSGSDASGPSISSPNPAIAAFDNTNDAAFLAAQFAPKDLAKAQAELQHFIAYQHRLAALSGISIPFQQTQQAQMGNIHGGGNTFAPGLGLGYPFAPAASPYTANGLPNIPTWQLMMAQQQALSAYGSAGF